MDMGMIAPTALLNTFTRQSLVTHFCVTMTRGLETFVRQTSASTLIEDIVAGTSTLTGRPLNITRANIRKLILVNSPIALPLTRVRDILASVEHDETYSSPEKGLHYGAIERDLMSVLSDAYNRNVDTITASPRLEQALMPMTADAGQLAMGRGDVSADIKQLHWMSIAADLLVNLDSKQPLDEFTRERCFVERPAKFLV
jgi:hypothetical protein